MSQSSKPRKLRVKNSTLPGAGKGLFTLEDIGRNEIVVEYQGEEIDWQEYKRRVERDQDGYLFFMNWKKCIDAFHTPEALGRYANDARGFSRVKGCRNNAVYKVMQGRVFIVSTRRIRSGEEIFVNYGADYWRAMRHNRRMASSA